MPLISDKDRYNKLSKDRGALKHSVDSSTKTTNHTLRESEKIVTAERKENFAKEERSSNVELGYHKDGTANEVYLLFTLNKGESLVNVSLSHFNAAGTNIYELHWSFNPPGDLTFTVGSDGKITAVSGGDTIKLLSDALGSGEQHSLLAYLGTMSANLSMFDNVSQPVYFYYVSSRSGTDITYAKIKSS